MDRAEAARETAWQGLPEPMKEQVRWVETIRDVLPGALIIGDSTQPIYAANLFYDHDRAGGWFVRVAQLLLASRRTAAGRSAGSYAAGRAAGRIASRCEHSRFGRWWPGHLHRAGKRRLGEVLR